MAYTREQIEELQAGPELDKLVHFYLDFGNPIEASIRGYIPPIDVIFTFDGQTLKFIGTPPYSENLTIAKHALAKNSDFTVKRLPSGDYSVTLLASGRPRKIAPIVADTEALALCRAGLISKISGV